MSNLKFKENLFLGKQELERFTRFLVDDGFRLHLLQNSFSFGIIRDVDDTNFNNYRVESGSLDKTIKFSADSFALDNLGQIIFKRAEDNIAPPDDGNFHWVKIKHLFSPIEEGTVSVDVQGNLVGTNTKFTEILRGEPNFPSRIKFIGASLNTGEFDVVSVTDDTNIKLSGVFQVESNLQYKVVGTFTPGHVPPTANKDPFQYDSVTLSFELETVLNTPPTLNFVANEEFYIARVKVVGLNVTIEDKRTEFWRTKADFDLASVDTAVNKLLGVEEVKFDSDFAPKDRNIVKIAWGFRTTNFTVDSELRKITVSGGNGGLFKSTGNFITGDFDGWKIYAKDGTFRKIILSVKSGTQINLTLDVLDVDDYTTGDELIIVPDVEEVEILASSDGLITGIPNIEETFKFAVNLGFGEIRLIVPVLTGTYKYNLLYRYKTFETYTIYRKLEDDSVGYFDESSFDTNGTLKANPVDRNRVPYTGDLVNGYITLTPNTESFKNKINILDTGDLFGVNRRQLDNASPQIDLEVGTDKEVQIIDGTITLTVDHVINLKIDPTNLPSAGNSFWIIFDNDMTQGSQKITINSNFTNVGSPGVILHELTPTDFDYPKIPRRQLVFKCTFDGSGWTIVIVEEDPAKLNDIVMRSDLDLANFDGDGRGTIDEFLGWHVCNGLNNTIDMRGRFPVGFLDPGGDEGDANYNTVGNSGGFLEVALVAAEIPRHFHEAFGDGATINITLSGIHNHSITLGDEGDAARALRAFGTPSTTTTGDREHTHANSAFAGRVGGGTISGLKSPADKHENRPPYRVLGFIQRIPFTP